MIIFPQIKITRTRKRRVYVTPLGLILKNLWYDATMVK
jgi:hypothetical protein